MTYEDSVRYEKRLATSLLDIAERQDDVAMVRRLMRVYFRSYFNTEYEPKETAITWEES